MPLYQIAWLTAANFPHKQLIFYSPLNPTKIAVSVPCTRNWQIQSVYQLTLSTLKIFWTRWIFSVFLSLELNFRSCISWHNHFYYGWVSLTKISHICPLITSLYWIPLKLGQFAEPCKLHGLAETSSFGGKLWSLLIAEVQKQYLHMAVDIAV